MALAYVPPYVSAEVKAKLNELNEKGTDLTPGTVPVSEYGIYHWCEALEDGYPLYIDPAYAKKSRYKGIIAPWCSLSVWTLPFRWPWPPKGGFDPRRIHAEIKELLKLPVGIQVATEIEFHTPIRVGDVLYKQEKLVDITVPTKTRLGVGHFCNVDVLYQNQKKELVARQRNTYFDYGNPSLIAER